MDCDNTQPPKFVLSMLRQIEKDNSVDVIIASRYRKGSRIRGVAWYRQITSIGARAVYTLFLHVPHVRDYIRYLVNSCISTVFDTGIVWILLKVGVPIVLANTIGVVGGFILGYILSFIFVWDNAKSKGVSDYKLIKLKD